MTVVVTDTENEDSGARDDVAFAAGEATAHVGHLSEEVAEAVETAETATIVAEGAANVAAEAVSTAELLMAQSAAILSGIEEIKTGLIIMSEGITELLEELRKEPEPEPEPPKRDTAPRRKSGAHKFLYG